MSQQLPPSLPYEGPAVSSRSPPFRSYDRPSFPSSNFHDGRGPTEIDVLALEGAARAAAQESDRSIRPLTGAEKSPSEIRVDSAQSHIATLDRDPPRQAMQTSHPGKPGTAIPRDSISDSPTLLKHAIHVPEGARNTLPAVQPTSATTENGVLSSEVPVLPSFSQLAGQLNELAEAATQQDVRGPHASSSHHHSHSLGSTASQSLVSTFHHYPTNVSTSPASYSYSARSPTSIVSDAHHHGSPPHRPLSGYRADRTPSQVSENGPKAPASLPSLPSTSSSGESHGPTSSTTDGYSTTRTTPIEPSVPVDGATRPILPPAVGLPMVPPGSFKCDYPGCNAFPFQTQYLLSSHQNVHSQSRPHYCPVAGCPRSEAGNGFKRKNEMIRHGLVHSSPGYICPFCSDREHRYPRPDNLQRHVRGHHMDKDRNDPALLEVLSHRTEGTGKTRRRRTIGSASSG